MQIKKKTSYVSLHSVKERQKRNGATIEYVTYCFGMPLFYAYSCSLFVMLHTWNMVCPEEGKSVCEQMSFCSIKLGNSSHQCPRSTDQELLGQQLQPSILELVALF